VNLTHARTRNHASVLGSSLQFPDHSTLGRRAPTVTLPKMDAPSCWAPAIDRRQHGSELNGPGEWRIEKNGKQSAADGINCISAWTQSLARLSLARRPVVTSTTAHKLPRCQLTTFPASVTDTFGTLPPGPSRLAGCQRIQSTRFGRGSDRPLQACHRQRPSISYRGV